MLQWSHSSFLLFSRTPVLRPKPYWLWFSLCLWSSTRTLMFRAPNSSWVMRWDIFLLCLKWWLWRFFWVMSLIPDLRNQRHWKHLRLTKISLHVPSPRVAKKFMLQNIFLVYVIYYLFTHIHWTCSFLAHDRNGNDSTRNNIELRKVFQEQVYNMFDAQSMQ